MRIFIQLPRRSRTSCPPLSSIPKVHRITCIVRIKVIPAEHCSPALADRGKTEDIELAEPKRSDTTLNPDLDGDEKAEDNTTPCIEPVKLASRWVAHAQFFSLCFTLFVAGWNDGTTGPLLPRMQSNYHVRSPATTSVFFAEHEHR